ncbi:MAG: polysaccharide biosynthesis/export family protein [Rubripirellula sp.]
MRIPRSIAGTILGCLLLGLSGCSSLGLSCFPTGHFLTEQSEAVLDQSPRVAEVPRELQQSVVPAHYLQPGDVLLIEPADLESEVRIPADQQVMIDGTVDLGGFGRVVVSGLTLEVAESLIEQTIEDSGHKSTKINVRLLEPVDRYYVLGEVNSPGSYPLSGHESVLDGILTAGGLTSSAAPCKLLLARPTLPGSCRVTLPVCYREITQMGDTSTNYQLQPGDRIFVATRSWCEELKFWDATKTCPRCCGCQSACPDPQFALQGTPVSPVSGHTIIPPVAGFEPASEEVHVEDLPGRRLNPQASPQSLNLDPRKTRGPQTDDQGATILEPATQSPTLPAVSEPIAPPAIPEAKGAEPSPTKADGELDFGVSVPSNRFEPLWITSSR